MTWQISDVTAEDLITEGVPTFTRGDITTLEFIFLEEEGVKNSTTAVLGGDSGTTLGGDDGGTLGTAVPSSPEERHDDLMQLIEYDSKIVHGRTMEGEVYVREYQSSNTETKIVAINHNVGDSNLRPHWAGILDGTDTTRVHGFHAVELEIVMLARLNEYASAQELKNDMSSTLVQL